MTDDLSNQQPDSPEAFPPEVPAEDAPPVVDWGEAVRSRWQKKWAPPCPDGNRQRLATPLGFWERNTCELELRVALCEADYGACQVIVDEHEHEVHVRVLVCCEDRPRARRRREYVDCPVRVWLERPLGERAVIDVDTDEELALFTPAFLDNVPQPDHGYRPARRRRRRMMEET